MTNKIYLHIPFLFTLGKVEWQSIYSFKCGCIPNMSLQEMENPSEIYKMKEKINEKLHNFFHFKQCGVAANELV